MTKATTLWKYIYIYRYIQIIFTNMIQIYNVHLYNLNSTTVIVPIYHFWYGHNCNWSFDVQGQAFIFNTLRPRQNGRHFADDTFKRIFSNDNVRILIKISLKFNPKGPIINIPALVQIMAWRRPGDKPLSEPMLVSLLTHICVTLPQWVNTLRLWQNGCQFPNDIFKCIFLNENIWI